jgi:hypothetical protein
MGAKTYNVDLSHGGGKIGKKPGESKGVGFTLSPLFLFPMSGL